MPPANDNFANATLLVGDSGSVDVDNTTATSEPDDGATSEDGKTLWFTYVPSADGLVTIDTFATEAPLDWVTIGVYVGATIDALVDIVLATRRARTVGDIGLAGASFYAFEGREYHIILDTGGTNPGVITLTWLLTPAGSVVPWNNPVATVPFDQPTPHPDADIAETFEGYASVDEMNIAWALKDVEPTAGWADVAPTGEYIPGENSPADTSEGNNDFAGATFDGHQTLRISDSIPMKAVYTYPSPVLKTWQKYILEHDSAAPYGWYLGGVTNQRLIDLDDGNGELVIYYDGGSETFLIGSTGMDGPTSVAFPFASTDGVFLTLIVCYDIMPDGPNAGHQLRIRLFAEDSLLATFYTDPADDWDQIDTSEFLLSVQPTIATTEVSVGLLEIVSGCHPYSGGDFDELEDICDAEEEPIGTPQWGGVTAWKKDFTRPGCMDVSMTIGGKPRGKYAGWRPVGRKPLPRPRDPKPPILLPPPTPEDQPHELLAISEIKKIPGSAYSDTAMRIPAGVIVVSVSTRVISTPTGADVFDVGVAGDEAKFASGVSTAVGTTDPGTLAGEYLNATAVQVRLTMDPVPTPNVGFIRVTVTYYYPVIIDGGAP